MKYTFTTVFHKEGRWYVGQCVELGITSQGRTVLSAKKNLKEAVELFLEDQPKMKSSFKEKVLVSKLELQYV